MDWNRGFSAQYDLMKVDPVSFMDMGLLKFTAGTIDNTGSGLMQSADLTMTENPGECWVRVYLKTRQDETGSRVPLFTGLTSVPERKMNGVRPTYNVECYSVLKPADDILVPRGYYAPAGADAARLVAELLNTGPAPVEVDAAGPTLEDPVVAEDSMSRLDVAWLILNAIGWRLRIEGDGTIHVSPQAVEASTAFNTSGSDVIELDITDEQDWFSVPNCIRVISGNKYVEYKDADPESTVSTVSRKASRGGTGEIWMSDTASAMGSNESMAEYAIRTLREKQAPARKIGYARRYLPGVLVGDLVVLSLASVKINGVFRITGQKITLGHGCRTTEEVVAI